MVEQLNQTLQSYGFSFVRTESELKEEIEEYFSYLEPLTKQDFVEEMLDCVVNVPFKKFSKLEDVNLFISKLNGEHTDLRQKKWWLEKVDLEYSDLDNKYDLWITKKNMEKMMNNFFEPEMENLLKTHIGEEVYNSIRLRKVFDPQSSNIEPWQTIIAKVKEITKHPSVCALLEQMKDELSEILRKIYLLEVEKHASRQRIIK